MIQFLKVIQRSVDWEYVGRLVGFGVFLWLFYMSISAVMEFK